MRHVVVRTVVGRPWCDLPAGPCQHIKQDQYSGISAKLARREVDRLRATRLVG